MDQFIWFLAEYTTSNVDCTNEDPLEETQHVDTENCESEDCDKTKLKAFFLYLENCVI